MFYLIAELNRNAAPDPGPRFRQGLDVLIISLALHNRIAVSLTATARGRA